MFERLAPIWARTRKWLFSITHQIEHWIWRLVSGRQWRERPLLKANFLLLNQSKLDSGSAGPLNRVRTKCCPHMSHHRRKSSLSCANSDNPCSLTFRILRICTNVRWPCGVEAAEKVKSLSSQWLPKSGDYYILRRFVIYPTPFQYAIHFRM